MKVSEVLLYPYSRAQMHFKEAARSEWKGRTVHYVIGVLEFIPIINYLVLLVDLAVRPVFKKAPDVHPRLTPQIEFRSLNFDTFVERFGISFETPLQAKLKEIQQNQSHWTEQQDNVAWDRRVRPMRKTVVELLALVNDDSLKNLQQNRELSPYEFYLELKEICARLQKTEQNVEQQIRQTAMDAFRQIQFPVIESVDAFVYSLGFTTPDEFKDYYDVQQTLLSARGIKTVIDLDCLGLRKWDEDLQMLKGFQSLLKQRIGEAQYTIYKNELRGRLRGDENVSVPLDENIWDQDIDSLVQQFEAFVILRQKELLKTYLNQYGGHAVWQTASEANPNMGLQEFCQLHQIQTPSGCYSLSVVLEIRD